MEKLSEFYLKHKKELFSRDTLDKLQKYRDYSLSKIMTET